MAEELWVAQLGRIPYAEGVALQVVAELSAPTDVTLRCAITGTLGGQVRGAELTAVEVGSVDGP